MTALSRQHFLTNKSVNQQGLWYDNYYRTSYVSNVQCYNVRKCYVMSAKTRKTYYPVNCPTKCKERTAMKMICGNKHLHTHNVLRLIDWARFNVPPNTL